MELHLDRTELLLRPNQPLGLRRGEGVTVRCLTGTAWLTVSGNGDDVFLGPGQSHRLDNDALALVEAVHQETVVSLEAPCSRWSGWLRRLSLRFLAGRPRSPRHVPYYRQAAWVGLVR